MAVITGYYLGLGKRVEVFACSRTMHSGIFPPKMGEESHHTQLFTYLHDCYKEDSYNPSAIDIFKLDSEDRRLLTGVDHAAKGFPEPLGLDSAFAERVRKAFAEADNGLEFVYGFLFVVGKFTVPEGKTVSVAAPLFMRSITEDEHGDFYPSAEFSLNRSLLSMLLPDGEESALALEEFESIVEARAGSRFERVPLSGWLGRYLEFVDQTELVNFPECIESFDAKKRAGGLSLKSSSAVYLQKDPESRRGILSTLRKLSRGELKYSEPLKAFLGKSSQSLKSMNGNDTFYFRTLSDAQLSAIRNAKRNPLSIVYGPPGTGKSYTAASLAIDHLATGKSVLIVSKRVEAGNVIAHKIQEILGQDPGIMYVGRQAALDASVSRIDHMLFSEPADRVEQLITARAQFSKEHQFLNRLKRAFGRIGKLETKIGELEAEGSIKGKVATPFLKGTLSLFPKLSSVYQRMEEQQGLRGDSLKALINELVSVNQADAVKNWESSLQSYRKYIRARKPHTREKYREDCDFRGVLKVFPIWVATFNDLFRFFPNQSELFDLVIIDEASQCDLASAVPALLRAKRAVISGDPNQLRHFSFLSYRLQESLAKGVDTEQWNYRNRSVLDRVMDLDGGPDTRVFLDEYYRSPEALISFSNRRFYSNRLKCIQSFPGTASGECFEIVEVADAIWKDGRNAREASEISTVLEGILQGDQSVGIIAPFQKQVDAIVKHLESVNIRADKLKLIGTPYGFQGNEVDVLIVSLAVTDTSHPNLWRILDQPNLFNVMMTRARKRIVIFRSFSEHVPRERALIRGYIDQMKASIAKSGEPCILRESKAVGGDADRLLEGLRKRGYCCTVGVEWLGAIIDVIVDTSAGPYVIDLVGGSNRYFKVFSRELYEILSRAGIIVIPISIIEFRANSEAVLKNLIQGLPEPLPR